MRIFNTFIKEGISSRTLEYYRLLIDKYRELPGEDNLPEIFIDSMDMYAMFRMIEQKQWNQLVRGCCKK